ncbi:pyridoxamine 5'-phosphate oxidase family protein [Parasphingorhabdus cellanae]|uniref:Pyridoxamine 5'-phosphate oxidase family protein n=1 Tax=Parasphingorhabdus cellanae TaxID=2806553 RepID=A0ABX7T8H0_9SPHN|nr:pyridoxamine 5'-phosphate oxidase family protein [Parasphingorhabdus cellanae]QTD57386.1 pyridoxamine 5'-phosphate oxidase family protein [Parasphingorhabdus cellanae]
MQFKGTDGPFERYSYLTRRHKKRQKWRKKNMRDNDLDDLYDMIDDVETAMLVTENAGALRSRPMKGKLYRDSGEIWFLTESESGKTGEIDQEHSTNLTYACPEKETYISISGTSAINRNVEKIDDLWGPWASIWFGCEKDDPKVAAICFRPDIAEYWSSPESKMVQAWELAKAYVTDDQPEIGTNKTVAM